MALTVGACTEEPEPGFEDLPEAAPSPSAESSPSPAPSPTEEPSAVEVDVDTTPEEITPEWVTAVVNTLLEEYGEISAEILAMPVSDDPRLPGDTQQRIERLFAGQYLDRRINDVQRMQIDLDGIRSRLLPADQFTGLRYTTELVQYAQDTCIIAVGRFVDEGTVPSGGTDDVLSAVSLVPRGADRPGPTDWTIIDVLPNTDANNAPMADEEMLAEDLAGYGSALDHECIEPAS